MHKKLGFFWFAIAAVLCGAAAVSGAQQLSPLTRHVRDVTANGQARLVGHLPSTQPMRMVLVLPHRDQAGLDEFLKDLYDPSSASYRKFLTVEEFTERFGPSQEDYDAVIRFAEANGFTVVGQSRNRMNLDVTGTAANVEKAFHVTMGVYQHPSEDRTFFAPDREPTPELAVRLWRVAGLDNYSTPHSGLVRRDESVLNVKSNATTGSGPSASFLGSDMRAAYYGGTTLTGSGQSIGLFEFIGIDLADISTYYSSVGQTNNVPITLKSVDTQSTSCVEHTCDDTEQVINVTQALGMAPGLSSLVIYIGTGALSGQTLDDAGIFNAMATASPLNAQLSDAWQWKPADNTVDDPYFEEFAAQGQNLFVGDGDDGQWRSTTPYVWPADSPYVTSVGGTDLETTGAGGQWLSETGWADGGGGISPDDFPIPSWQVATAAGCANCSQTYRNGPDVSANADFSFYVCADQFPCTANLYGGTSFAAPMWAGYMALVNEQAESNGNPPLGFINPALYRIGLSSTYDNYFHDITSGGNTLGTATGYDLSTGWGSPQRHALIDALAGSLSAARLTSPAPGSTLPGPSVTFQWVGNTGVTTFDLWLGTSGVGSNNLWSSGSTTATSATVGGLPTNGETIYARLFAIVSGVLQHYDYTFTATSPAMLTSPTPGGGLPGPNATFMWSPANGATGYDLWLGTSGVGSNNLWSSGMTTATSVTFGQLPASGVQIYARLFTYFTGGSAHADFLYTAASAATLTSPTQGFVFTSASQTFQWSPVSGVAEYSIWVGSSAGSNNLGYTMGGTTSTSYTLSTLPTNGETIYVRLWTTYTAGGEAYVDYTFTAFNAGP